MNEWMPIESAPKDGTPVLLASAAGAIWWARWKRIGPRAGERWESFGLGAVPFHPTHWFQVSEPPK